MKHIVTFGETMLRFAPCFPGERVIQASQFLMTPGGSESNVAVALSKLGNVVQYVGRFPNNELTSKIIKYLKGYGVGVDYVSLGGERVGIYYLEYGIGPRPWNVIYDRKNSSFSEAKYSDFKWEKILNNACWFHSSGITPAVSKKTADILKRVVAYSATKNIPISIDLNYRAKLRKWATNKKEIIKTMTQLCSEAVFVYGNETDFQNALGIGSGISNHDDENSYIDMVTEAFNRFRKVKYIALGLRKSFSASENMWTGMFFVRKNKGFNVFKSTEYRITDIVDRLGVGDSYCGGLIHGLINYNREYQKILDFAVALSALKHTITGDACEFSQKDISQIIKQKGTGTVIR